MAGLAHGYALTVVETAVVDNGGSYTSTVEVQVVLEGAPDIDTATALGLGSTDAAGAMTLDAYTTVWPSWSILPPMPYVIGATAGDPYAVQMVAEGYDLGGFGTPSVGDGVTAVVGTATITHAGNVNLTVSAADLASSDFSAYQTNLFGSTVLTPEPGTALFLLLGGLLGLVRRR
jgi:hypothetical protein